MLFAMLDVSAISYAVSYEYLCSEFHVFILETAKEPFA